MTDLGALGICMGFGLILGVAILCTYEGLGLIEGPGSLLDKILEKPAEFVMRLAEKMNK